jgi:hypothetical protein
MGSRVLLLFVKALRNDACAALLKWVAEFGLIS